MFRGVVSGVLSILVVVGVLGLLDAFIYSNTKLSVSSPRVTSVSPSINNHIPTLLSAGADLAAGNLLGAVEEPIDGVEFDLEVEITNEGVVPVILGKSTHILVLNGAEVIDPIELNGGWLGPGSATTVPLEVTVLITKLPGAVVLGIVQGGEYDVQLKSKVGWAIFSKTVTSQVTEFQIIETLESLVRRLLPGR